MKQFLGNALTILGFFLVLSSSASAEGKPAGAKVADPVTVTEEEIPADGNTADSDDFAAAAGLIYELNATTLCSLDAPADSEECETAVQAQENRLRDSDVYGRVLRGSVLFRRQLRREVTPEAARPVIEALYQLDDDIADASLHRSIATLSIVIYLLENLRAEDHVIPAYVQSVRTRRDSLGILRGSLIELRNAMR